MLLWYYRYLSVVCAFVYSWMHAHVGYLQNYIKYS